MKTWNVRVCRDGCVVNLGQVHERNEELARCAALSRFGVGGDELASGEARDGAEAILPDDDFEVFRAVSERWPVGVLHSTGVQIVR